MKRVLKTISLLSIVGILYFIASCDTIGQPAEGKSVDTLYVIDKDTVYAIDTTNPKIHIATGEYNLNDPYFIGISPDGSSKFRYPIDSIKPNDIVILFESWYQNNNGVKDSIVDDIYDNHKLSNSKYYWSILDRHFTTTSSRNYLKILIIEN